MDQISKPHIVSFLRMVDRHKWIRPRIRFASVRSKPELITDSSGPASPDGNTVSLEDEIGSMLENRMRYETYASILEAQFEQIRTSVQEGR